MHDPRLQMVEHLFKNKISETQAEIQARLNSGRCPDYPAYKAAVSELAMVETVLRILDETLKEVSHDKPDVVRQSSGSTNPYYPS